MPLSAPPEGVQPVKAFRRDVRGLTQGEVADALDVDQGTYSKIENGIQLPSLAQLDALGEILGAKPGEMFSVHILAELAERRARISA